MNKRLYTSLSIIGLGLLALQGCATTVAATPTTPATPASATAPSAQATTPPAANGSAAPAAAASAAARPAAPTPGSPRPYAEVIKEAKVHKGLFTVYEKEEKLWLELKPEQLNQLYFLQVNVSQGLSSSYLAARRMLRGQTVMFRRVGNNIQMIARNLRNVAPVGSTQALAITQNTSDSLLGSTAVASAPHAESKAILIELNGLLLSDLSGLSTQIDATYRTGYALDARNSYFEAVKARPEIVTIGSKLHYAVPKLPAPPVVAPPTPAAMPNPVTDTPDARSFFLGMHLSFTKLPEQPMRARLADGRVGHFNTTQWDFGDERNDQPKRWLVNRWRLEKKDPSAALSEPKKPITYWLDKNIPVEYREAVAAGVLEWNKAFERIGFKNALVARQQEDNAEFDTNDTTHASIRWVLDYSEGALGVGPSVIDPRTGEILDADIGITHGWARLPRYLTRYQFTQPMASQAMPGASFAYGGGNPANFNLSQQGHTHANGDFCTYANDAMEEAYFGMDLLAMRGLLGPDSAAADAIAKAVVKDVVTHEVGHTLGLRHNFRASTIHSLDKLKDPAFTKANGLSGSVMDYNAWNIALGDEKQGEYVMSTLGAYDYWAVEYAYKEIAPDKEKSELAAIAARGVQPELAYATDEETAGDGDGMDPTVNQRDLGSDPLAFAERRVALSKELLKRMSTRGVKPGESYGILSQSFRSVWRNMEVALAMASKYVGGVTYVRDHGGTSRMPFTPVAAAEQRRALKLINSTLFTPMGFDVPPQLAAQLAPDALERGFAPPADVQPNEVWLAMQRGALDRLMSDRVAQRITQTPSKLTKGDALPLSELYDTLQRSVWAELRSGGDISAARRALQREHLRRVTASLIKPSASGNADARALNRLTARELLAQIRGAKAGKLSREARAHLDESATLLEEALKASLVRAG
jgi:hypothetical protein